MKISDLTMWIGSICVFIAVFVCIVCNMAVTNTVGWLVYPVSSLLFAWLVLMPLLYYKKRGLKLSFGIITTLTLPFLLIIEQMGGGQGWFIPLGFPIAVSGIIFMWAVFLLIKKGDFLITLSRIIFLSGILCLVIDLIIKHALGGGGFPWGSLVAAITTLVAILLLVISVILKKRGNQTE